MGEREEGDMGVGRNRETQRRERLGKKRGREKNGDGEEQREAESSLKRVRDGEGMGETEREKDGRETRRDIETDRIHRGTYWDPRCGPTHHSAHTAPAEWSLRAGTALPAHPGRTGQVPAGGAIPVSACKGRREANKVGWGWGGVKGNAEAHARRRGNRGAAQKLEVTLWAVSA